MLKNYYIPKKTFVGNQKRWYPGLMKIEDLIGKWTIKRGISTSDGAPKGTMQGSCFFDIHEGGNLLYQEQLWHETEHQDLLFARKFYRYHFLNDQVDIYFYKEENNRLFLSLPNETLKGEALCKEDHYSLQWNWINPDTFMTLYQVRGPKKELHIESEFRR